MTRRVLGVRASAPYQPENWKGAWGEKGLSGLAFSPSAATTARYVILSHAMAHCRRRLRWTPADTAA